MSELIETDRILTQRRQLGRPAPRRFSQQSRYRFNQDRRATYLAEHAPDGNPTPTQSRLIGELIEAEWQRQRLQAEADAATNDKKRADLLRFVDRTRLQIILLGRDLTSATTRREAKAPPKPLQARPADYLARR